MEEPINSKDLARIQSVNNEFTQFINQIEEGHAPNPGKLLKIEQELKSLVQNKAIPDAVKQNLQAALNMLTNEETENNAAGGINLYGAKTEVDHAIQIGKRENEH